ncbi:MAG: Bug family tripartite tricarboxylate transporter substrate binding protein [Candidatus Binatia bacterium]
MSNSQNLKGVVCLVLTVAILTWLHSPSQVEAAEPFAGKTIRILIGYPPGGGHDLEARVMARTLPKYLPGKPSIIVQNMPGAGGMIQAAYTYNLAKADGLTIGLFGRSHGIQALLLKPESIKYNLAKMPLIWSVAGSYLDIVREFLGAKTAKDLLKVDPSKIVVAGRSKGGSSCVTGQLSLDLVGIKGYKPVCAYKGTAVIAGAFERGEVSFFNASDAHLVGGGAFVDMYKRGMVFPMWQTGILQSDGKIIRSPTIKGDVPTLYEFYTEVHGKPPSGVEWDAWMALSLGMTKFQRSLVLPPGTPPSRVKVLREGINRMARDPKFVARWERIFGQKLAPVLVPPAEGDRIKAKFMAPAPWQEYLRQFVWG